MRTAALALALAVALVACGDPAPGPVDPSGPDGSSGLQIPAPPLEAFHDRPYEARITVHGTSDAVRLSVPVLPSWMTFDPATATLGGTPGWRDVGSHALRLEASTASASTARSFTLVVEKSEIDCGRSFGDPDSSEYVLPFPPGRSYEINQGYCPPNPAWGHHRWFAYDFRMPVGDTVVASRAGQVLFVEERWPDGTRICGQENYVYVGHPDGTVMQYVHLTTGGAFVVPGARVEAGQPLGLSGDSGCSSGPHLHVALFRDGTDFGRRATLPLNYRNADGPLNERGGLVQGARYRADGG